MIKKMGKRKMQTMKVIIHENPKLIEDYAEIYCSEKTSEIAWAFGVLRECGQRLAGKSAGEQKSFPPSDVFYFESVDKKTFAYLEDSVWEVGLTLKEAEDTLGQHGFVRINKSTVVNIYKIDRIRNDFEMRSIICLDNRETLVLNRHYKRNFHDCLEGVKNRLEGKTDEADH